MKPHTLHLIAVDPARRGSIVRGVRDALRASESELSEGQITQECERILAEALAGKLPIGLVQSDDLYLIRRCADALVESSRSAATAGVDLSQEDLDALNVVSEAAAEPDTDDDSRYMRKPTDDEALTDEGIHTALMVLAQANGNVAVAYAHARALARTTGDEDLWSEVCRLIVAAFDIDFT